MFIKILDLYYSTLETIGIKLKVYAWSKRWCDREKGTGYKK